MYKVKLFAFALAAIWFVPGTRADEPITFKAHTKATGHVAFSPHGGLLITAGQGEQALKLWNVATHQLIREFTSDRSSPCTVQFSSDGKRVLGGFWDKRIRIWDVATGKLQRVIQVAHVPTSVAFSPDHTNLAVAFHTNQTIQLLDAKTGVRIETLTVPMTPPQEGTNGLSQVAYSPDGKRLVAVCGGRNWPKFTGADSVMAVWDTLTWRLQARFPADQHTLTGLVLSPDGRLIAGACYRSKWIKVWRMPETNRKKAVHLRTIKQWVKDLDADMFEKRDSADRALRAIGAPAAPFLIEAAKSDSAEVQLRVRRILQAMEIRPVHVLKTVPYDLHTLAFSPDGKLLAQGSRSARAKSLCLWKMSDSPQPILTPLAKGVWSIDFSPDGKQLVIGNPDGSVSLLKVKTLVDK